MDAATEIDHWRRRGTLIDCLGQRLFVVDEGAAAAPVVLLIHGFPTSGWDWHRIMPQLTRHFRVLAPDMLGFGLSDKPRGHRYTIAGQADLLEHLMAQRGVAQWHILAHDYGDTVAQELLARDNASASRRCLSAALLNGGLFPEATRPRLIQRLMLGRAGSVIVRFVTRRTLARNMKAIFGPATAPGKHELDVFWALINAGGGRAVFHRLIRYMAERDQHRERWLSALRDTPVPRLLINGSFDPISGAHLVARYRELITTRNIVELPQIGHYPQMEAAADVVQSYLSFMREYFDIAGVDE